MYMYNAEIVIRGKKGRFTFHADVAGSSIHDATLRRITRLEKHGLLAGAYDFSIKLTLNEARTKQLNESNQWSIYL